MALTFQKHLKKHTEGRYYVLSSHATMRLLERSVRAPAWLLDVVQQGQFALLQFKQPNRRRYALVFDALTETYLVVILGIDHYEVITVLTLAQYENTYGPIEPVFFKLAQLARVQPPPPKKKPLVKVEQVFEEVSGELSRKEDWVAWNVYLLFSEGNGKHRQLTRMLSPIAWDNWIMQELRQELSQGLVIRSLPLDFRQKTDLLMQSPKFHAWIVKVVSRKKESFSQLERIFIKPRMKKASRRDVTEKLYRYLVSPE